MFFHIRELELHPVDFREKYRPEAMDYGPDLRQKSDLVASGRATIVEEHRGAKDTVKDIRLVGDYHTRVETQCARCLEPVGRDLASEFDLLYRPLGADAGPTERPVHEGDTEIGYYQGDGIELQDVLREQILLAVPLKAVCRDECKGLCPHCGRNLNHETCQCEEERSDPRWEALKDLRNKLQE